MTPVRGVEMGGGTVTEFLWNTLFPPVAQRVRYCSSCGEEFFQDPTAWPERIKGKWRCWRCILAEKRHERSA